MCECELQTATRSVDEQQQEIFAQPLVRSFSISTIGTN